ncbi:hypothetical protein YTPLAS18_26830 [Nitrospira sp.]|nr:hypothetical protein YTPLAS18_26830 [Nitrospira sp.]
MHRQQETGCHQDRSYDPPPKTPTSTLHCASLTFTTSVASLRYQPLVRGIVNSSDGRPSTPET